MKNYVRLEDEINTSSLHSPSPLILEHYKNVPEINETNNRGERICRPLFSHSELFSREHINNGYCPSVEIQHTDKFDFQNKFIYSVFTHHNQKLWTKHLNLLPKKILDGVRNNKGVLVFDNSLEGNRIDGEWFIEPFYKSITELNLPPESIFFITNNLFAESDHDSWFCAQKQYNKKINLISFMYDVSNVKNLIIRKNLPSKVNIDDEIKYKSKRKDNIKHFLKINRTNRPERNLFMLFMNYHKLLDKSLISFPKLPDELYPKEFEKYLTEKNVKDLKSKVPFDIDETDKTNHGISGKGKNFFDADLPFQPIHYRNSFVSVIMAAFPFEQYACHLHASTFNPIYGGQPIIQFGPLHSLREMKKRGFKTFDSWWDESYDDESNGWKRFQKVMDITLKLSKLSYQEMLKMYIDMKDVLQHNVNVITNYNTKQVIYNKIFNKLGQL